MKTKSFVNVAIFLMAGTFFVLFNGGCSKDEVAIDPAVPSIEEKNADLELLGKAFAKMLNKDEVLHRFLVEKAKEKITYDYDVPYFLIKDELVQGRTIEEHLRGYFNAIVPDGNLKAIIRSLHYVQLTIPIHLYDSWSYSKPLSVAVIPISPLPMSEINNLVSYDSKGNKTIMSAKSSPKQQMVVVGESHRIDGEGRLIVNHNGIVIPENKRMDIREIEQNFQKSSFPQNSLSQRVIVVTDDSLAEIKRRAGIIQDEIDSLHKRDIECIILKYRPVIVAEC